LILGGGEARVDLVAQNTQAPVKPGPEIGQDRGSIVRRGVVYDNDVEAAAILGEHALKAAPNILGAIKCNDCNTYCFTYHRLKDP